MTIKFEDPRWLRDLARFLPLKSQFVLSGNIRDLQAVSVAEGVVTSLGFNQTLARRLRVSGYAHVFQFDPLRGFQTLAAPGESTESGDQLLGTFGLTVSNGRAVASIDLLGQVMERLVAYQTSPVALIVDFASRLAARVDSLNAVEQQLFTTASVLSHRVKSRPTGEQGHPLYNTIIWIVEKEGDLPDWLLVNNPRIRHIPVAKPDAYIRRALAPALLKPLSGANEASGEDMARATGEFVDGTEGLLLLDLTAIATLARVEGIPLQRLGDAVRRYKVGVTEDPWLRIDQAKIRDADGFIAGRVKGQGGAVRHMLDIIKRARTGVGGYRRGNRPRGVAFFAGPTGTGKTELAKTISSLLFGDESAYIRFDMSEFSAEHSDQRLIGAPPGYVGYDVGGELTNAVREKPFSVLLFDEIEKAHPRILDKFLQILDDGVLTSGRGDKVYFSETLIIFTSNLGIYRTTESGERVPTAEASDPYETFREKVIAEIQRHFKLTLNRPELLNRIGENLIVFDFIRPEVANQIFDQMMESMLFDLTQLGMTVRIPPEPLAALRGLCLQDLSNGGRGIRNQLEARLLNPVARGLFDLAANPGEVFEVCEQGGNQFSLVRPE